MWKNIWIRLWRRNPVSKSFFLFRNNHLSGINFVQHSSSIVRFLFYPIRLLILWQITMIPSWTRWSSFDWPLIKLQNRVRNSIDLIEAFSYFSSVSLSKSYCDKKPISFMSRSMNFQVIFRIITVWYLSSLLRRWWLRSFRLSKQSFKYEILYTFNFHPLLYTSKLIWLLKRLHILNRFLRQSTPSHQLKDYLLRLVPMIVYLYIIIQSYRSIDHSTMMT